MKTLYKSLRCCRCSWLHGNHARLQQLLLLLHLSWQGTLAICCPLNPPPDVVMEVLAALMAFKDVDGWQLLQLRLQQHLDTAS
jgi:hypothetical protein